MFFRLIEYFYKITISIINIQAINTFKVFFLVKYCNFNQIFLIIFGKKFFLRPNIDFSAAISFTSKQYIYNIDNKESEIKYIIDAGSNIGQQTIKFYNEFQEAKKIISIEIDKDNFDLLKKNTSHCENVLPINCALSSEADKDKNYKKHANSEMSRLSNDVGDSPIKTTSINQLILDYKFPRIDILKFNIEGNETDVFFNNCEWIDKCKIIAFNNAHLQNDTQKILENFFKFKKFKIVNVHQFIFLIDASYESSKIKFEYFFKK
jgi:FkbM family methyltransferase